MYSCILLPLTIIDQLGTGGAGYIWSISEGGYDDEWRHSVAPIPAEKLVELTRASDDELDLAQYGRALPTSGELKLDSNDSEDDDSEDIRDESIYFEKEVKMTSGMVNININILGKKTITNALLIAG